MSENKSNSTTTCSTCSKRRFKEDLTINRANAQVLVAFRKTQIQMHPPRYSWSGALCPIVAYLWDFITDLVIGVDCVFPVVVFFVFFFLFLSAMPLSIHVWWNLKLGDLYVYQCNSEAFVMIYLRNVSSLSIYLVLFFSLSTFTYTLTQLEYLKLTLEYF